MQRFHAEMMVVTAGVFTYSRGRANDLWPVSLSQPIDRLLHESQVLMTWKTSSSSFFAKQNVTHWSCVTVGWEIDVGGRGWGGGGMR